ncbi:hypothetical protein CI102_4759 [Trichoderma harzianum]|uniref:MARVEL domain-containing protein n=1 Tax=Trichoderma harzianum CBS 226.95 TaxID=983964 RepID=A0A2T4AJ38_TRIHA|nr:hypothetical protein M431DRAFT_80761 [Trichoderma harzianum CBS 226.95]PKK50386.1 hypothetical protein CI102_4759 [Trichoderma harzianum]PTB57076.1 hypothetical protein M431DRAFT_80761 [Trichoderma harzianum CBS 226.95]
MSSSTEKSPPPPEAQQHQESQQTVPPPAITMQQQQPGFQPYIYAATNAPQVSYVPYPGPTPTFDDLEPVLIKPWEITKTVFHVLSFLLAAAGIGLGFSSLNFTYFAYTVCIIALLWSLIELIVRAARKFQKHGIHPGAHIALSLIIFLVATVLTSLFGPWFQDSWGASYATQSCGNQWNSTTQTVVWTCTDDEDNYAAKHMFAHERSVSIAVAVVTYLIAAIHFTLFVGACVDTSRVNAAASRPIYVIAQPAMMQQGWQMIPQVPIQPSPVVQQPVADRDVVPAESEKRTWRNKRKGKGKGKEPALNNIEEQNETTGQQS